MQGRLDITEHDVFISWTGADRAYLDRIAQALRAAGIEPLLSSEECQGDFEEWSREAALSARVFMPLITDASAASRGMAWEAEALDRRLSSEEGALWREMVLPVAASLAHSEAYRRRLSAVAAERLEGISSVILETEDGQITDRCLREIVEKATARIVSHFHDLYRRRSRAAYIKLVPLCSPVRSAKDASYQFRDLYVPRRLTETDGSGNELETAVSPDALLSGEFVSFIYGPAGCGKSQYVNQIREAVGEDALLITLPAVRAAEGGSLFSLLSEEFRRICGERRFFTEAHFAALLRHKRLVLVLDGMDEITTRADTRLLVEKVSDYYATAGDCTTLIFTGRNEEDRGLLAFGDKPVRGFRLDRLTEEEIAHLGASLFLLFGAEEKGQEFYVRIKDLSEEIRSNPLLLSQLALVYHDEGRIPETVTGILDAVSEITLRADRERGSRAVAVPEEYRGMVERDIGDVLRRFARERYLTSSLGREISAEGIFRRVLRLRYGETQELAARRAEYLLSYLRNRAIFLDGHFYHKMFLEYLVALSYSEESLDGDYGEIVDTAPIRELFSHYGDPYWSDVIKLFLVKADSLLDGEGIAALYGELLSLPSVTDPTLLLDVCRELIRSRREAEGVIVTALLDRGAKGIDPPYGPLLWFIPTYGLYEALMLSAWTLRADCRAVALARDVCFLFGYPSLASVTDRVDGAALLAETKGLCGVRRALLALFCVGETEGDYPHVYPRCFSVAEARSHLQYGHGVFDRADTPFTDELGLFTQEMYSTLGTEYIGMISVPNGVRPELSCRRLTVLALTPTDDTDLDYIPFDRSAVRVLYAPENCLRFDIEFDRHMPLTLRPVHWGNGICYLPAALRHLTVPRGITELDGSFSPFGELETVRLPLGLRVLAASFTGCARLRRAELPETLLEIGSFAFRECTALAEISLPTGLRAIGSYAFSRCTSLTELTLPTGLREIGTAAFSGCTMLREIALPDGVEQIPDSAFEGCRSLAEAVLPDGLVSIGVSAFAKCAAITRLTLPETLREIGRFAFRGCSSLTELTLPTGLRTVGTSAFSSCTALCSLTLPRSDTRLGVWAFRDCTALTELTLPSSLSIPGNTVFRGCDGVRRLILDAETEEIPFSLIGIGGFTELRELILPRRLAESAARLPDDIRLLSLEEGEELPHRTLPQSKEISLPHGVTRLAPHELEDAEITRLTLPETLLEIGDYALRNCKRLAEINLPEGLHTLGVGCFTGCESLTESELPDGIRLLPSGVFFACSSLRALKLPAALRRIGRSALAHCEALETLTVPEGTEQLGEAALRDCRSLAVLRLPRGLREIGASALENCTALTELELPPDLQTLGSNAISRCISLRRLVLPDTLTRLESSVLSGCAALTELTLPKGLVEIGDSALRGCRSLTGITLPESLRTLGACAFEGCGSLTRIHLPDGLGYPDGLGRPGVFMDCAALTEITLPSGITHIPSRTFRGCTALTRVTAPSDLGVIGIEAFAGCRSLAAPPPLSETEYIGERAFADCASLTELTLPETLRSIGDGAFEGCVGLRSVRISANFKHEIRRIFGELDPAVISLL